MAQGLPDDGKLTCIDINEEFIKIAQRYWKEAKVEHKVDVVLGSGLEVLTDWVSKKEMLESFDFGFIDADKPNQPAYQNLSLQLLRPGGFLILDNMFFNGKIIDPEFENQDQTQGIKKSMSEALALPGEKYSVHTVTIGDGVTFIYKHY